MKTNIIYRLKFCVHDVRNPPEISEKRIDRSVPFAYVAIDHSDWSQQPVPRDFPLFKCYEWLVVNCNVGKWAPLELTNRIGQLAKLFKGDWSIRFLSEISEISSIVDKALYLFVSIVYVCNWKKKSNRWNEYKSLFILFISIVCAIENKMLFVRCINLKIVQDCLTIFDQLDRLNI